MSVLDATPPKQSRTRSLMSLAGPAVLLVVGLYFAGGCSRLQSDPPRTEPAYFDLSNPVVPLAELQSGGPPKDGIPALTDPPVLSAMSASYLDDDDRVIGVILGGKARAYPLKILNSHEIVNDTVGGDAVAVTYCPLCDSAAAFDRRDGDRLLEFGVSGLLYNSNVLMYDRGGKTESLWSQLMKQGISGPRAATSLRTLPLELTTWDDWKSRYPKTEVLSDKTGHARPYDLDPYADYFRNDQLWFPVKPRSDRLPPKTPVLGVWTEGAIRAYPITVFNQQRTLVEDQLGGHSLKIRFNPAANSIRVQDADDGVHWVYSLWFAWYAFHPQTEVFGISDESDAEDEDAQSNLRKPVRGNEQESTERTEVFAMLSPLPPVQITCTEKGELL